jgi:hypothetical protein
MSLLVIGEGMLTNLPSLIAGLFTPPVMLSFLRVFLPLAFLPFVALGEQFLWLPPYLLIMLTPGDIRLFNAHHIAAFLGILFVSVATTIARLPVRWARLATVALAGAAVVGYLAWSAYPGGRAFNPARYASDEHVQIGQEVLAQVPPDAAVAAQSRLAVHLAARKRMALFPWLDQSWTPQMILLDEKDTNPYPLTPDRLKKFIREYEARPTYKIVLERDGYFIFAPDAQTVQPLDKTWVWPGMLQLQNYAVSQADGTKPFVPVDVARDPVTPGGTVRVELYWKALAAMNANYDISVRLVTADNQVVAQDDAWPARGLLSTLQWPAGQQIRDVHYLAVPARPLPNTLKLQVLIYNADTQQRAAPQDGYTLATFGPP